MLRRGVFWAVWAAAIGSPGCGEDTELVPIEAVTVCECCGNGKPDPGEECDDGNLDPRDACTTICVAATCGDGIVRRNVEECDDGNTIDDDSCSNECKGPKCGNGIVETGEACDGAPTCDDDCKLIDCGDGYVSSDEECDDPEGPVNKGSCTQECRWNDCGDGWVYEEETDPDSPNELEACDDGNRRDDDGCDSDCELEAGEPP